MASQASAQAPGPSLMTYLLLLGSPCEGLGTGGQQGGLTKAGSVQVEGRGHTWSHQSSHYSGRPHTVSALGLCPVSALSLGPVMSTLPVLGAEFSSLKRKLSPTPPILFLHNGRSWSTPFMQSLALYCLLKLSASLTRLGNPQRLHHVLICAIPNPLCLP